MSNSKQKYFIVEDSPFTVVNIINIIETQSEESEITVFENLTDFKAEVEKNRLSCDLLILDLNLPDGSSLELIPRIRELNEDLIIIVSSSQTEIRTALACLDYGATSYVCKGETFSSDLMVTLKSALKHIELRTKNNQLKKSIFAIENYPMVLFKISEMGVEPVYQDFDVFPEYLERSTEEYIMNLGISFSMLLGDDMEYYEGAFILPAGASKFFEIMLLSFRIPDKNAFDVRLRLGFFQLCLFVQKSFISLLPHADKMSYLVDIIKSQVVDAEFFTDETLIKLKSMILAEIVKLV
ncbi:MAG: KDP operon transcriptional regulatory protein KdpE [Candidatus Heimdallarchaeota archaeon LC_2]|nr:MAG: KDP operon transcriptional regulatory protein KdpE [Candidatus Heimdallarchaeota archaeon LC_2]